MFRNRWTPTERTVALGLGLAAFAYGAARRNVFGRRTGIGSMLRTSGLALLAQTIGKNSGVTARRR